MSDNDRHVVPHAGGGWDVKAPGAERASSHHDTQAEAIDRAREIIGNAGGGELVTHGMDGRIRESDTVAAARHDTEQAVEQPAVVDAIALPVDPSPIDLREPASTHAMPIRQGASEEEDRQGASEEDRQGASVEEDSTPTEEEDSKPSLGDKLKSLLHRSSD
jgi:hypothetical protein